MPLGLMLGMDYEQRSFQFEPGDCALLHSDGLAEAHAPDREMFGFPRVSALVGKGPSGEALIDLCLTELGTFTGPDPSKRTTSRLVSLQRSPSAWHQGSQEPAKAALHQKKKKKKKNRKKAAQARRVHAGQRAR